MVSTRISLFIILCGLIVDRADGSFRPEIAEHTDTPITIQYGKSTTLFCNAKGSPLPSITWRKGYKKISSNRIEVKNLTSTKVSSTLTISNVTMDDDKSLYKCKARNINESSNSVKIVVIVDGKPSAPGNVKSLVVNSTSIWFFWDAAEKNGGKILYYTLYYNADKETGTSSINITGRQKANYSTLLTGLKQFTTYMIYISATNGYGQGKRSRGSADKTVPADPEPPMISLSDGENSTTHQTITLNLVPSSQNKETILAYQIFVENIEENPKSVPLKLPEIYGNHSLNKSKDHIYIAVEFEKNLPHTFTLGKENWKGSHYNARLKPLTKYRIYVRALGKSYINKGKIVFGKANTLKASTTFPAVPKIVQIKATTDSLEISWNAMESKVIYYKLLVKQGEKTILEQTITNVPYKFGNLEAGETYMVYLSVCIEKKCKSKSVELRTITKAGETSSQVLIIIIAVGIVVVLLILIIAVVYFVRRRKRQKEGFLEDGKTNGKAVMAKKSNKELKEEELELIETKNGTAERAEMELIPVRSKEMVADNNDSGVYTKLEWECSRDNISVIRVFEYDNFGKICKGSVKNIQDVQNGAVMMRILKDKPSESLKAEFSSVLEIMKRLPAHKGLTNLLGCITKQDPLTMIIEYVPYGDLLGYLRVSRGLHDDNYKSEKSLINDLRSAELMSFAEQIAAAMAHLERYKIMHCDLAARNVLMDRKGLCKLTGFGEYPLVFDKDTYSTKKKGRLLIKWAAIEVVFKKIRTIQSDVWSFGVLLYEIATVGGCPYNGKDERWLLDMLKDDYRMPCPEHVSEALYSVMLDCWKNDPNERPNFEKLVKVMRTLTLMNKHQDHINMTKYDGQLFSKLDDI